MFLTLSPRKFAFLRWVSLCMFAWSRTQYIDQAILELTETQLPLPPKFLDQRCVTIHLAEFVFYKLSILMGGVIS